MAKIVFTPQAKSDLTEIGDYIAFQLSNKAAARNVISQIRKTVMELQHFSHPVRSRRCMWGAFATMSLA